MALSMKRMPRRSSRASRRKSAQKVAVDEPLRRQLVAPVGPHKYKSDRFREAVHTFIRFQATQRLRALGGAAADMKGIPRRRTGKDGA